jgi:hypothetical protein
MRNIILGLSEIRWRYAMSTTNSNETALINAASRMGAMHTDRLSGFGNALLLVERERLSVNVVKVSA